MGGVLVGDSVEVDEASGDAVAIGEEGSGEPEIVAEGVGEAPAVGRGEGVASAPTQPATRSATRARSAADDLTARSPQVYRTFGRASGTPPGGAM